MTLRCTSTSRTDAGRVRRHNEDACLARPDLGLWAVADGMGGHSAGDVASMLVIERLEGVDADERLSVLVDEVEAALDTANAQLRRMAAEQDAATIGSTVAVLLVRGEHAVCLWAGDSRIYRIRDDVLQQITQDHALVADLVDRGLLTAEQAVNHPQSNLVTRAVGAADAFALDLEIVRLMPGDRFVLCSDGLDKEVGDDEILRTAIDPGTADAADALVELALSRGSRDNVTVVVVQVESDDRGPPLARGSRDEREEDSEDTLPGFTTGADLSREP